MNLNNVSFKDKNLRINFVWQMTNKLYHFHLQLMLLRMRCVHYHISFVKLIDVGSTPIKSTVEKFQL